MIPEAAVEAAAKAHWENGNAHSWADECGGVRADGLADMRAALEAAAPHMTATARSNVSRDEMFAPHACLENGGWHEVYISGGPNLDTVTYCRRCGTTFDGSDRPSP